MYYHYSSKEFSLDDLKLLKRDAKSGDADSLYLLANYYEHGLSIDNARCIKPNHDKALALVKQAYENGSEEALIWYANHLTTPGAKQADINKGVLLYKKAIAKGDGIAAANLARHYCNLGKQVKTFEYFMLADKLGGDVSLDIGQCYYYGLGVQQNIPVAIQCYKKVMRNEHLYNEYDFQEANFLLGRIYLEGLYAKQSIAKAKRYLLAANRDNDHRSAAELLLLLKN
jgi:uncharacterized protein